MGDPHLSGQYLDVFAAAGHLSRLFLPTQADLFL